MKLNNKTNYAYILIGVGTAWLLISLLIALYMFNYGEGYLYFGYGRGGWYSWCVIYDNFRVFFIDEFFNFEECFYGLISMLGILILIVGIIVMFTTKPVIVSPQQKSVEDDKVENLIQLKTLLANGVITQEEFEEKKKQMLNM